MAKLSAWKRTEVLRIYKEYESWVYQGKVRHTLAYMSDGHVLEKIAVNHYGFSNSFTNATWKDLGKSKENLQELMELARGKDWQIKTWNPERKVK